MTGTESVERATPAVLVELLEYLQTLDGVLASGVCFGNYMVVYRHQPEYPLRRDQAKLVWRTVRETFERMAAGNLPTDRVHWSFTGLRLYAVYRHSVAIGVMMDPASADRGLQHVQDVMEAVCANRLAA